MTLPRVFHDVFIVVAGTLAEAIEGEVGPVLWILRMFETNLQRALLKFERFSSLRKRCWVTRRCGPVRLQTVPQLRAAAAAIVATRERTTASVRLAAAFIRQPTVHHAERFDFAGHKVRIWATQILPFGDWLRSAATWSFETAAYATGEARAAAVAPGELLTVINHC